MDSLGTWPQPLSGDDRAFDRQVLQRLRSAEAPAAGDRPGLRERLGTSLLLVIPLVSALVVVLLWQRAAAGGSALPLVLIAVVLVVAAVWWVSRLKRAFAAAQQRLGTRLADVVVHGVGVVREVTVAPVPDRDPAGPGTGTPSAPETAGTDDGGPAPAEGPVRARLELSVTPVRGERFSTVVEALYDAGSARRLEAGAHGPVRFLRDDPAGTTVIETRLSAEQVQEVYRAAALN